MNSYLKRILLHTCVYFTVTTLLLLLIYQIVSKDTSRGMQPLAMVMMLPFSLCFAAANVQFAHAKISKALRVIFHYLLTVPGAFVCLYLPNKSDGSTAMQGFVLFIALTLIYAAFMTAYLSVLYRIKRVTRDETEYKSVYKNK